LETKESFESRRVRVEFFHQKSRPSTFLDSIVNGRGTAESGSILRNSGTVQLSDEIPESELVDRRQSSSQSSFNRLIVRCELGDDMSLISTDRFDRLRFRESGLYNCFPGGGRGLNEYSYFSGDGRKADSKEVGEFLIGRKTEFEGDIGIGEDGVDEIFSLSVEELKLMEELI